MSEEVGPLCPGEISTGRRRPEGGGEARGKREASVGEEMSHVGMQGDLRSVWRGAERDQSGFCDSRLEWMWTVKVDQG